MSRGSDERCVADPAIIMSRRSALGGVAAVIAGAPASGNSAQDGSGDWGQVKSAMESSSAVVDVAGARTAVGGVIDVPFRAQGYVVGQELAVRPNTHLRFAEGQIVFWAGNGGAMFRLLNGANITGGDFRGQGNPGHCFLFPDGHGAQRLMNVTCAAGWRDEPIFYELAGGSRSVLINPTAMCESEAKFAVKIADGFTDLAVPRHILNLQTNGRLGIDFGGCNGTFVVGGLNGGIRTTNDSRGYHIHGLRVANQRKVEIRGHGATLTGGWNPVPVIESGADNIIWNGYCNSGHPIDNSGNSRNCINFPRVEYAAEENFPVLRQGSAKVLWPRYSKIPDNRADRPRGGRSRAGSTYTFDFYFPVQTSTSGLGRGSLSIDLPEGCPTSNISDQCVLVFLHLNDGGRDRYVPVPGRIFSSSSGQKSTIRLYGDDGAPLTGATLARDGKALRSISGTVLYTA